MLCKDNMANLNYKSKNNNTKHIFPSFFFLYLFLKGNKITYHEMHECYAIQILESKKTKHQKEKGHKEY